MRKIECNSCHEQAPDPAPVDMTMGACPVGTDGWAHVIVHVYRSMPIPPAFLAPGRQGECYYARVTSTVHLCPKCARRTFDATGCAQDIPTEAPIPAAGGVIRDVALGANSPKN